MRFLALAFVFLGLSTVAMAGPAQRLQGFDRQFVRQEEPRLRMPGEFAYVPHGPADRESILDLQNSEPDMPATSGISFGAIHAESYLVNGHRRVHYGVDGLTLLGGDIGGSVSRHGAMLTLHWASSGN